MGDVSRTPRTLDDGPGTRATLVEATAGGGERPRDAALDAGPDRLVPVADHTLIDEGPEKLQVLRSQSDVL